MMLVSTDALVELFRQEGLKITPQRRSILEALSQDASHPTAEEIYRRVSSALPDISRTTVYNTLRELVALGQLAEVQDLMQEGTRYDVCTDPHHHLFCLRCHALVDIGGDFQGLELDSNQAAGYRIVRRQVTFYGYCPNCQEAESGG